MKYDSQSIQSISSAIGNFTLCTYSDKAITAEYDYTLLRADEIAAHKEYIGGINQLETILGTEKFDKEIISQLKGFARSALSILQFNKTSENHKQLMHQVRNDFNIICSIASDNGLPLELRREKIYFLHGGTAVCMDGSFQNIQRVCRELQALKSRPLQITKRINDVVDSEITRYIAENNVIKKTKWKFMKQPPSSTRQQKILIYRFDMIPTSHNATNILA